MDEKIRGLLKEKFDALMKSYLERSEVYYKLGLDSRERNKGTFGYLDERPDLRFGHKANRELGSALASISLIVGNKENSEGECSAMCINCFSMRYGDNGWYCQVECECD